MLFAAAVHLRLRGAASIEELKRRETESLAAGNGAVKPHEASLWQPEYASYMIEALPGAAVDLTPEAWLYIESSVRNRREKLQVGGPQSTIEGSIMSFSSLYNYNVQHARVRCCVLMLFVSRGSAPRGPPSS